MNILKFVSQGGLAMLPLLALSVIALAVVLERTLFFASLEWGGRDFRLRLREYVRHNRIPECALWLTGLRGAISGVAQAGLNHWERGPEAMENAMVAQAQVETMALNRYLMMLETTITASPLIGLLGTITGMMGVFRSVSEKISANPQADTSNILAGIGEALVATATGILVAVFCLFLHNLFQRLAERQMEESQVLANQLLSMSEELRGY
ncbi:MotA/TolQ/ExbB proton channel family protein [bacterium]|nr:MotA/TolQ/ExbB proton channel family protein [bacterium]